MCGIAGRIGPAPLANDSVARGLRAMRHRGPDGQGVWRGAVGNFALDLLHVRLAIIDLDPRAGQPFIADDCVLIHNGEIYNFVELRHELAALGHAFRTSSDTEVVVKAYRQWGKDAIRRFEGMFAFALMDRRSGKLLLARDRFGEKPLYWAIWDGAFYFASEVATLAALHGRSPRINGRQIRRLLVNGYKSLHKRDETYFEGVGELPAATLAELSGPIAPSPERYWTLEYRPIDMTLDEAIAGTRERLLRSLELRLRADVPIAFCLSGGVDSTALASLASAKFGATIEAFSVVDGDPRYDETDNLSITVDRLGCRHHVTRTSTSGFLDRLSALTHDRSKPVATISYYVHSLLSEAIRDRGFKVAISGTGADELFTGYYDHYGMWLAEMATAPDYERLVADWQAGFGSVVRNPYLRSPRTFLKHPGERRHIYLDRELFNDLLVEPIDEDFEESSYTDNLLRNRMLNELRHESVPVMLEEDDANSMRVSIENRSPFLDSDLATFAFSVPNRHLIHAGMAKWLLRAAAEPEAPAEVMRDRRKRGFNASIESLIDRSDPETKARLLSPSPIFDYVRRDAFAERLGSSFSDNSLSKFLFSFIAAKLFLEGDLVNGRARSSATA